MQHTDKRDDVAIGGEGLAGAVAVARRARLDLSVLGQQVRVGVLWRDLPAPQDVLIADRLGLADFLLEGATQRHIASWGNTRQGYATRRLHS